MDDRKEKVWAVTCDQAVVMRGLTYEQAWKQADYLQRGCESHISGTSRRVGRFEIVRDGRLLNRLNRVYREEKTHTMVTI